VAQTDKGKNMKNIMKAACAYICNTFTNLSKQVLKKVWIEGKMDKEG